MRLRLGDRESPILRAGYICMAVFAGVCAAPLAYAAAECATPDGCAAKACRLDAQIAQVKAGGDVHRLPALERARAELVHCSDDGLKQKRKMALEQAQQRIDKREADLKSAQAKGDPKKIKAAQKKLDGAHHAFDEIQSSPL